MSHEFIGARETFGKNKNQEKMQSLFEKKKTKIVKLKNTFSTNCTQTRLFTCRKIEKKLSFCHVAKLKEKQEFLLNLPVCVRRWQCKSEDRGKDELQKSHLYGFSPV